MTAHRRDCAASALWAVTVALVAGFALTGLAWISVPTQVRAAPSFDSPPSNPTAADDYQKGKEAFEKKDWNALVLHMDVVVAQDRSNADAWTMLGYGHRMKKQPEKALLYYSKALALKPWHRGALAYSGKAYADLGDTAKARAQLEKLEGVCRSEDGANWQKSCDGRDELLQAIGSAPAAPAPSGAKPQG